MSLLDATDFVAPVDGKDDLFQFTFGFGVAPEGKAATESVSVDADSITELDDGDLLIEGWAANFEGLDRENENFSEGAFQRGIKSFLDNQGSLCFHHKRDQAVGRVLDLREVEGKGLYMKARVDRQEPTSPLYHIYNGVKKGSIRGLSVGGFFKRKLTPQGWRIADMDFTEISVTPVPVHPATAFAVVAGKALSDIIDVPNIPDIDEGEIRADDLSSIIFSLDNLTRTLERINKRGEGQDSNRVVDSDLASL